VDGSNGTGGINAVVSESVAAGNPVGFFAVSNLSPATITLFQSVAANNRTGIKADNINAKVRMAQSMVTGNSTSWINTGSVGAVQSYGDNYIDGNGDGDPTPPSIVRK